MKVVWFVSALLAGTASASAAGLAYAKTHPRIHEIHARLHAQNARIDRALADHTITAQQASTLHAEDALVRSEVVTDESLDKGHLTKADRRALNQQLNDISRQIGGDPHPRLHEIDRRLHIQTARIDRAENLGKITSTQAGQFQADDAAIKSQEVSDETADDGHITRAEQRALNESIDGVRGQIGAATGATGSRAGSQGGGRGGSHR